jgi:hypothetical protein
MHKWTLIGAWVLVAALATTLTWQIVSAADEQVSDRPVAPLQVGAPLVTTSDAGSTTQTSSPLDTGPSSSTPINQAGSSSSTSTSPSPPSSAGTTSTTTIQSWQTKTIPTAGGVVVVTYRTGEVALGSATPAPGFATEIKKSGPSEVEVQFESEEAKYEVRVRWSGGQLSIETDVESEED